MCESSAAARRTQFSPSLYGTDMHQVGGMMRTQPIFKRVILRYSINGQIEGISEETWRPEH
jgi:hypothetical protein